MNSKIKIWSFFCFSMILPNLVWSNHDDIHAMSDEFDQASTLSNWSRLYQTENWVADQLEAWLIDDTRVPGHMLMMPYSSAWFSNMKGVLAYKEISGDFVATVHLTVYSRHGATDPIANPNTQAPNRQFSLAGIFLRNPSTVTQGAPLPYSPIAQAVGAGGSDWAANQEDYIFLAYGSAGNAGTRQYEVKSTVNSNSDLYYRNRGVPDSGEIWLQLVRVGDTLLVLRRHPQGQWVIENRYIRPDFSNTLQLGLTAYTDWNRVSSFNSSISDSFHHNYVQVNDAQAQPDLIAQVDYFRVQRPNAMLSSGLLNNAPIDYTYRDDSVAMSPLVLLSSSDIAPYLGDNANSPATTPTSNELDCIPVFRMGKLMSMVCI